MKPTRITRSVKPADNANRGLINLLDFGDIVQAQLVQIGRGQAVYYFMTELKCGLIFGKEVRKKKKPFSVKLKFQSIETECGQSQRDCS